MLIDLSPIAINSNSKINIDGSVVLDEEYYKNTDIRKLSEVKIKGSISDEEDSYELNLNIKGVMTLPCVVTLVDVDYPFDIEINEIISKNESECEDYLKIINNTLDIMPIIWQNIVVEIPMKVVSPNLDNTKLKGDGWELLTEEEKISEIDPRLEKLKDLLDD
jgi:uncharacterized protein